MGKLATPAKTARVERAESFKFEAGIHAARISRGDAEPMTPRELGNLARRLAKTKGKAESSRLAKEITRGFHAGA